MRHCRNKIIDLSDFSNLTDPDIGRIGEEIGCRTLKVDNRNVKEDNYGGNQFIGGHPDTMRHEMYGYIEIKISTFNPNRFRTTEGAWSVALDICYQECDNVLIICMDENQPWDNVKRAYMIPCRELIGQMGMTINPRGDKYEKFKTGDKPYNDTWHNMKKERYLNLKVNY